MSLRDDLTRPIPGDNPGGVEIRYDPVFDKIKEARREEDDVPQGGWSRERKTADWPLVIKLARDVLTNKSKDLQVAAWLTEASLRQSGFAGLRDALDVLTGLLETNWDHLYPEVDDGDAEMRAAPLEWVGLKLDHSVRLVPIDRAGHSSIDYKRSRSVPTEADAAADSSKAEIRAAAQAAGAPMPEDVDRAVDATPKDWYKTINQDLDQSLVNLETLNELGQARFGDVAPGFNTLRDAIEEIQRTAKAILKQKLVTDPDAVAEPEPVQESSEPVPASAARATDTAGSPRSATGGSLSPDPLSKEDAAARIVSSARWLRHHDSFNPASYLLLRGYRWGELRASGATIDPKLLEAPTTAIRTNLKALLLDRKWKDLLEAAEGTMGTPYGRGWLDLQRYALAACDELGSDYGFVGQAIRSELRGLLTDLPGLLDMTLMDDTPTANTETRAWLRAILPSPSATSGATPSAADDDTQTRDTRAAARAEVRAGRADRAIALLMREAAREKTKRGRFLHQTELASIMVDAGHVPVAMPILEELLAYIETHRLEEWEEGELVARPMVLLYRALQLTQADPSAQQSLYLRICRLDPVQAMAFTTQGQ